MNKQRREHSMTLKIKVMSNINFSINKNDLEFQGHSIEIENYNYHHWIFDPQKCTHEQFNKKNRSESHKSCGCNEPPKGCRFGRNRLIVELISLLEYWKLIYVLNINLFFAFLYDAQGVKNKCLAYRILYAKHLFFNFITL